MKFLATFVFGATILAISLTGIANAQETHEKMTMQGDMSMMHSDPVEICSSMMKSMMSDPAMHRKMNEMIRGRMGDMSKMLNDPMAMYSSMMQSMMKDPAMHRRMNEIMRDHMQNGSMTMPDASQNSAPTSH
jgi:hypothetical protein